MGLATGTVFLPDQTGRQHDVLAHGEVREQVEALKNHAHVLAQRAHGGSVFVQQGFAVDRELTALELFQPVDAAQERALARTAFADDGDDFAGCHFQVNALEHLVTAIGLAQAANVNNRRGHCCGCINAAHAISSQAIWRTGSLGSTARSTSAPRS